MLHNENLSLSSSSIETSANSKHQSNPHHPAIVMEFSKDKERGKEGQRGHRKFVNYSNGFLFIYLFVYLLVNTFIFIYRNLLIYRKINIFNIFIYIFIYLVKY